MNSTESNNKAPADILKIGDRPNFQLQVANGQLEKPLAPILPKFGIGVHIFAENFVVMRNLTGPMKSLHFTRQKSVVIDTTHDLVQFPYLTMQVKGAATKVSVKL